MPWWIKLSSAAVQVNQEEHRDDDNEGEDNGNLTEYVTTRWYRAPEVILCPSKYSKAMDVWSVGCIFAELLGRNALFQGENYLDQIKKIISVSLIFTLIISNLQWFCSFGCEVVGSFSTT
mgnify:CR=1 FL=1